MDLPALEHRSWFRRLAALLVLAGTLAYWNSFDGIFLLDDEYTITDNATIDDWSKAFQGPKGAPSSGRPLTSFSFVLNFKLAKALGLPDGGRNAGMYHATNLLIHLGTGLTLFAFAANTLRRCPALAARAQLLAFSLALLWTLHPMNTSAVTYMSQRAESVMALCFLLCFWACERAERATSRRDDWYALITTLAVLAAMGKENAVALTFLVPLYDRAFLYSTWREAWTRRRTLYALLLIPWAFVLWIQFTDPRGGTVLLQYQVINPLTYLYTQSEGILMYLRKTFWPYPIILDYGWPIVLRFQDCWPQFLTLTGLVLATVWACVRRPRVGFAGAWFFIILGPSSSVIPIITEILAEHRMYLPMMSVLALLVVGVDALLRRLRAPALAFPALVLLAGAALGGRTWFQNALYADAVDMWEYNARHTPDNRRVFYNICVKSRVNRSDYVRAESAGRRALEISPDYPDAHMQMAIIHKETGRLAEAEVFATTAAQLEPDKGYHYALLAEILMEAGKWEAARAALTEGLRRDEQSQECMIATLKLQLRRDGLEIARRQAAIWMRRPAEDPFLLRRLLELADDLPLPEVATELRRHLGPSAPPPKAPAAP
jgi:hypothetical protein